MGKNIWMSFDLGIRGDYDGLYSWLDDHGAKECGHNMATFNYDFPLNKDLVEELKTDITSTVDLSKRDRVYIVWKKDDVTKGRFLFGKRKASPWTGFGSMDADNVEDY